MNISYIYRSFWGLLVLMFFLVGCTQQEDAVVPQETCDTVATVQLVPGCGLQLQLENNQVLVPVNVTTTGPANAPAYKINGFPVQVGQRIIVGYKTAKVEMGATPCNIAGYYHNKLVAITCIVGIEQGT
ncbi:MAG: hypothetical protein JWQ14_3019 [Adhaeribacter sp.]|nr:hypothetical protein [Adhaeribacter sp.]